MLDPKPKPYSVPKSICRVHRGDGFVTHLAQRRVDKLAWGSNKSVP